MNVKSTEISLIFNKILEQDLVLNNANVALLHEFVISWTNAAIRENSFREILQSWLKRVEHLHHLKKLNNGACIVTVFILEAWLNSVDLDQNLQYSCLLSQTFVNFHKLIVSACLQNSNEITSNNDVVIAFFRLHCCLSKKVTGVQLIRKYNLWKPLLLFYFQSNRFNLFIQNSCTEYINNLIKAEFPNELILFLEVLNVNIQCIKNAIENSNPLCDGVLFRSLRITHLLLSKYLMNMDADSLRLVSKRCLSLESYMRHLLILSKDETIVCNSLKIFVLLRIFLFNIDDIGHENELFQRLVATTYELLNENEKFNRYMPEIFHCGTDLASENMPSKLGMCSAYMQVKTVAEYLKQLDVISTEWMSVDSRVPKSEIFDNFFELYSRLLRKQNQVASIATNILKNLQNEKNSLDQDTRIYLLDSFNCMLKIFPNDTIKLSDELNNLLLNIINASSVLIRAEAEFLKCETIFSELFTTLMQITHSVQQYSVIIRLAIFNVCSHILRRLERIFDENMTLLRIVIVQGLNDSCWEIRDTVLEVLCEILPVLNIADRGFILANEEVSESLLKRLQDEESFVRATAYTVFATSILIEGRNTWEKHFDYRSLLENTIQRFQKETEGNVRERMLDFLVQGWRTFKICDSSLLRTIYETIHKASINDLHPEVRKNGMMFWKSLVEVVNRDLASQNKKNVEDILEKLFFVGCLQAIISGIEDEYDTEVRKTASEALQILKSANVYGCDFRETKNEDTEASLERLLNRLLPISSVESDLSNARQFLSNVTTAINSDYPISENISKETELDLNELLKCFSVTDAEGAEINQKDCY